MTGLYEILGVPFGFLLKLIYDSIGFGNYAISIVLLTLFSRLLMVPSNISQQKGMAKTQRIQPKLRRIQTKYAGNQQKIQEETNALYQREGYNPMNAGCAPMLIQFVLLFGLIGAIYYPLSNFLTGVTDAEIDLLAGALSNLETSSKFTN
ncbi:MAG: YidC/Oxa1 family membrane protein insertase, partial [Clostridia bacterium]|nr:YidC/Oxa1 family membrane protein insertase [Clostridia bacterium]